MLKLRSDKLKTEPDGNGMYKKMVIFQIYFINQFVLFCFRLYFDYFQ